jgi:Ca2+-binding EF-hand superfamily protein
VVTLSNGHNTNVINGDVSSLSAMPLTVAWAPQLFVQADANRDNQLTVGEFTDQLSRIGETADTAKALFSKFDTDDDGKLSIDEFVHGVQSNVATGGGALFSRLIDFYTVNPNDKDDKQPLNDFLAAGLAVANAYWSKTRTSSA